MQPCQIPIHIYKGFLFLLTTNHVNIMATKELTYKNGDVEIKFKFKEPETMGEYLSWDIPMDAIRIWEKSNKIEMGLINAMMTDGPKIDEKTHPKVFKFLQKNMRDFLE